jgi:ATP-dependent protease HslVU (ClpYQ) peptidase subunit
MKVYPYNTPDGIIELVDKRELDELAGQVADFGALVDKLERELQDAVKRMEQVTIHDLKITFRKGGAICGLQCDAIEAVRARLIQAAKGEA